MGVRYRVLWLFVAVSLLAVAVVPVSAGNRFRLTVKGTAPIYTIKGTSPDGPVVGYMVKVPVSPLCMKVLIPPGGFNASGAGLDKMVKSVADVSFAINGDLFNRNFDVFKSPIGTYVSDGKVLHYMGPSGRGSFIGLKDGRYMWMWGQPYIYTNLWGEDVGGADPWVLWNPEKLDFLNDGRVLAVIYTPDVNVDVPIFWHSYLVKDGVIVKKLKDSVNPHKVGGYVVEMPVDDLKVGDRVPMRAFVRLPWGEWFGREDVEDEFVPVDDVKVIFSGGPMLIYGGSSADFWKDKYHLRRHPFSFIGMTKDYKLVMLVFDGRQPGYSNGVLTSEIVQWALDNGFLYLLALDSGGSTILVERTSAGVKVVNRPSDGKPRAIPVGIGWVSNCGSDEP